jgi:hypothetical protein
MITCCMNSATKLVHSKTVAGGPTFRVIYSGISKLSCYWLEFKEFVSGTCDPRFEGHNEISYFICLVLIFYFVVVTEALR